jgi:hypothetical protein
VRLPSTAALTWFRAIASGPMLAHCCLVLSGIETCVAFLLILGVVLRPLTLVDKP